MDIMQLKYIVSVIENNFNITRAAQTLHISQPALSTSVMEFEKQEEIEVFVRSRGRLTGLTESGQIIYEKALDIIPRYDELLSIIRYRAKSVQGSVCLGIPPLVITALFPEVFQLMKADNPDIDVAIVEYGGAKLVEMLKGMQLDFAVLLSPSQLSPLEYREVVLHQGEITAYMSEHHPFAQKNRFTWQDLNDMDVVICDSSYSTYHLFMAKIKEQGVSLKSVTTVYSWDFIFETIRKSDRITVLPYRVKYMFNMHGVKEVPFDDPIPWIITLSYRIKQKYLPEEQYMIDYITDYFKTN